MTSAFSGERRASLTDASRAVRARSLGRPAALTSESLRPGWSATIATGATSAHHASPRPVTTPRRPKTRTVTIGAKKRAGGRRRSLRRRNDDHAEDDGEREVEDRAGGIEAARVGATRRPAA